MTSTQTSIPVIRCTECNRAHPASRSHCRDCGTASIFIADGRCLACRENVA